MALHILIDGYNLIKSDAIPGLQDIPDLQRQREALIERLIKYNRLKHHPITLVFDATHAPGPLYRKERVGGIDVRFSRLGQTADALIKNMVDKRREQALVVTADQEIARFAELKGATVVSCLDFGDRINRAEMMEEHFFDSEESMEEGWTPTTRKKGPAKRPSKKDRKALLKLKKL